MNTSAVLGKKTGRKFTVLTCYDFPTARALDTSSVDIVFVGDSVGTNMLGYRSELEVTMGDMVHHLKAVRKGITQKIVMADLPYQSYSTSEAGLCNARILHGHGAEIIKLEGGKDVAEIISAITGAGIWVMGHLGFQPQIAGVGKRAVVGALSKEAVRLYTDAVALVNAGVCGIVLECVPEDVAKVITEKLSVPTIGIGSGKYTDGQVLVISDVLGWFNMPFRFIRRYDQFHERAVQAANSFCEEVQSSDYPRRNHGFRIKVEEFQAFLGEIERMPGSAAQKPSKSNEAAG